MFPSYLYWGGRCLYQQSSGITWVPTSTLIFHQVNAQFRFCPSAGGLPHDGDDFAFYQGQVLFSKEVIGNSDGGYDIPYCRRCWNRILPSSCWLSPASSSMDQFGHLNGDALTSLIWQIPDSSGVLRRMGGR